MRTKRQFKVGVATLAALALLLGTQAKCEAGLIWTMQQVGPNVVVTESGSVDYAGLTFFSAANSGPQMNPSFPDIYVGASGTVDVYVDFTGFAGPANFGPGGNSSTLIGAGDLVGVQQNFFLVVPQGYVSGDPLSGSATYLGQTFSSLGVTPGTYTWTLPSDDTLVLQIGPAATTVPEPTSLALFALGGLALVGWRRWRKVGNRQAVA